MCRKEGEVEDGGGCVGGGGECGGGGGNVGRIMVISLCSGSCCSRPSVVAGAV